ncbi:hypothetical protein BS78_10G115600 [Paspalum vaginatum]|nr:hypothetical protein BS78_10G115600 [Paspalum vaginatum]
MQNMDGSKCLRSVIIVALMMVLVAGQVQAQAAQQACCPNLLARSCYLACWPFTIMETCGILCDCYIRDKGQCPPDHRW